MGVAIRVAFLAGLAAAHLRGTALSAPETELVVASAVSQTAATIRSGWGRYGYPLFQSNLLTRDADLATKPYRATE